jgi:hypothetical protein
VRKTSAGCYSHSKGEATTVLEKHNAANEKMSATLTSGQISFIPTVTTTFSQRPKYSIRAYTKDLLWWLCYLGLKGGLCELSDVKNRTCEFILAFVIIKTLRFLSLVSSYLLRLDYGH